MTAELRAIAQQDNWSEVYNLADTYRQQQQWQLAVIAFERAIELKPDFFWSWHHLADVFTKLQTWEQAVQAYNRAVELDPQFFWSWHNLADALTKLQAWEQAVQAYNRAVEIDSQFFWSWHNLADVLMKLEDWDRAIAIYLQAIQLKPDHRLVYQKLGLAFKQRGNLAASIQDYRRLIQSPPPNSIFKILQTTPGLLLKIADTLVKEHQTIGAIILYYLVLEIEPNQTDVLLQLTPLLQQHNQLEKNINSRRQILENKESSQLLSQLTTYSDYAKPTNQDNRHSLNQIEIKDNFNCPVLPNQLEDLCSTVGWTRRPLNQVQQALVNSFVYVSVWQIEQDEKQLIGFARAMSDGVFHATLLDIVVHPDFQGRGLGKTIVTRLLQQLQQAAIKDITLFASPHLVDFYHQLGFVSQPHNLQWMLWCPDKEMGNGK
jgi:Tfp pilus assembly protein PilF/ribosomal protein S18 acetylase RimI-like enzyme